MTTNEPVTLYCLETDEWKKIQPRFIDGNSVCEIEFLGDRALFANGVLLGCYYEDDQSLDISEFITNAAYILANFVLHCEHYYLRVDVDYDNERLDEFMMDWTWDDIKEYIFKDSDSAPSRLESILHGWGDV